MQNFCYSLFWPLVKRTEDLFKQLVTPKGYSEFSLLADTYLISACPYWKITVYSHFELRDLDSFLHIAHYKLYLVCFHLAWILLSLKAYSRICSLSLFHIQVSLL